MILVNLMAAPSIRSFVLSSRTAVLSPTQIGRITPQSARSFQNAPERQSKATAEDPKTAKAREYAIKFQGLVDQVRFELVAPRHFNHLMDMSRGFFEGESLCNAGGCTIDNCRDAWGALVQHSIDAQTLHPASRIMYDKKTNKPIAFGLYNVGYRDSAKDPFAVVPEHVLSEQEQQLFTPYVEQTLNKFWDLYPEEEVMVECEAAYMDPAYRNTGLFQVMIDYNVNFPAFAKDTGAKYAATVCTAPATKGWYDKMGFKNVFKGPSMVKNLKGEMVPLMHGELLLYVNDLREMTAVDVFPFWKEMGLKTTPWDE